MRKLLLVASLLVALSGVRAAEPPDIYSTDYWEIPGPTNKTTWVEIHNSQQARTSGIAHVCVLARKKGAPVWELERICDHLAITIVAEVTRRTPGYISWQGENWLSCCGDACEYHGDLSREELRSLSGPALDNFLASTGWTAALLAKLAPHYQPGGSPAIYKFVCRHCKCPKYGQDLD